MIQRVSLLLIAVVAAAGKHALALVPMAPNVMRKSPLRRHPWTSMHNVASSSSSLSASMQHDDDPVNNDSAAEKTKRARFQKAIQGIFQNRKKHLAVATLSISGLLWVVNPNGQLIQSAHASAPVMALPKAEGRDPATEAMMNHERKMTQKSQEELQEYNRKARQIEASQGEQARERFETEYKAKQVQDAADKMKELDTLKRDLLDQGICPFTDMEGRRQVLLLEKGIDLAEVPGTTYNLEKDYETKNFKKSTAYKKAPNRKMIQCMVQDMKNKDMDPLEYFEKYQEKTMDLFDLEPMLATKLAANYQQNLETYGQINVPKEGQKSALEIMNEKKASADPKKAKAEAKQKQKEAKALENARLKEEKLKTKAEAKAAKEQAKKEKGAAKEAAAAAAVAAAATAAATATTAASAATTAVGEGIQQAQQQVLVSEGGEAVTSTGEQEVAFDEEGGEQAVAAPSATSSSSAAIKSNLPIAKVSAVVVAVGGGVAFKLYRDKAAAEEEERQRQFRLIMGDDGTDDDAVETTDDDDIDLSSLQFKEEKHREETQPPPTAGQNTPPSGKEESRKRTRKIKNVFSKKNKNNRETDIHEVVTSGSSPEFSKLLAKILTFGAPGRFPSIVALPGDMPMESFDVEVAKKQLIDSRTEAGLTIEESAEIFANVVNCMLISIVDLASSTLKEKDDKVKVNAIGVVVDYMNHAASLYDSVAEGVVITPVTYGGDLSKSKLEQMYSSYAVSGMMNIENMDENFDSRVGLLQDVFQINEKKAEGLMMKAMQKNMMKMLKSGEGMEGMEDMLKGMGGMGGDMGDLAGLMGDDGEGPSPEQLKEMLLTLKEMKDSGSIPNEELETVKTQFKEAFGSSIDEVIQDGESDGGVMSSDDKELLDLMKSILGE